MKLAQVTKNLYCYIIWRILCSCSFNIYNISYVFNIRCRLDKIVDNNSSSILGFHHIVCYWQTCNIPVEGVNKKCGKDKMNILNKICRRK